MREKQGFQAVRQVEVSANNAGQRLDNFLLGLLKGVPRSHIYRIVRRGEVRVNQSRARAGHRLQLGDRVRIPPIRTGETANPVWILAPEEQAELNRRILYEDDGLLVMDKPAGLAVHSGSGIRAGLIEQLRQVRSQQPFLELVHRLDRDTSGCLLFAKQRPALLALHAQLRGETGGQTMLKRYLTLVCGQWEGDGNSVELNLQKERHGSGEHLVRVNPFGRVARSYFRPQRLFARASLMQVELETGRTHQIRAHATHLGHPIAGDTKYGDREFNRGMRKLGLRRMFLHASELRFIHPVSGNVMEVQSPLPDDLTSVLEQLESQ